MKGNTTRKDDFVSIIYILLHISKIKLHWDDIVYIKKEITIKKRK